MPITRSTQEKGSASMDVRVVETRQSRNTDFIVLRSFLRLT